MTLTDKIEAAHSAMLAVTNQVETMCREQWIAEKRIRALKAEMTKRAKS